MRKPEMKTKACSWTKGGMVYLEAQITPCNCTKRRPHLQSSPTQLEYFYCLIWSEEPHRKEKRSSWRSSNVWCVFFLPLSCTPSSISVTCMCSAAKLCPALCDSVDYSPPGSSSHRIFQARIMEWISIASSRDLPEQYVPYTKNKTNYEPEIQNKGSPVSAPQLCFRTSLIGSIWVVCVSNLFDLSKTKILYFRIFIRRKRERTQLV